MAYSPFNSLIMIMARERSVGRKGWVGITMESIRFFLFFMLGQVRAFLRTLPPFQGFLRGHVFPFHLFFFLLCVFLLLFFNCINYIVLSILPCRCVNSQLWFATEGGGGGGGAGCRRTCIRFVWCFLLPFRALPLLVASLTTGETHFRLVTVADCRPSTAVVSYPWPSWSV